MGSVKRNVEMCWIEGDEVNQREEGIEEPANQCVVLAGALMNHY